MSADDKKKYHWLKLDKDFFKRHDIRIIEEMDNGKEYIIFYLKLLCESTSHDGNLRFSDEVPYSDKMLATITNTNVDIVRSAIKVFSELKMIQIIDDGTLFMSQLKKMVGYETGKARRMKIYRDKKLLLPPGSNEPDVSIDEPKCSQEQELEQELELESELEKELDSCCSRYKEAGYEIDLIEKVNNVIKSLDFAKVDEKIYEDVMDVMANPEIYHPERYLYAKAKANGWLKEN